jgi:hypothetical protein
MSKAAPPTPQIGPEHIEALADAIEAMAGVIADLSATIVYCDKGLRSPSLVAHKTATLKAAEQRAARLAEIRAYLESLR